MTVLLTSVKPSNSPDVFSVLWRVNNGVLNCLNVSIDKTIDNAAIASELAALHHLLMVKEIAGNNRNGRSLKLHCHHGAIKKLSLGKSGKRDLINYAQFLRTRFCGAQIKVSKQNASCDIDDESLVEFISLEGPLEDVIYTKQLGDVNIRHHVVERYMERSGSMSLDRAWRKVSRIIQSGDLRQIQESEQKQKRNILKHGKASQLWSHKDWLLRFVPDNDCLRLVTIFKKPH